MTATGSLHIEWNESIQTGVPLVDVQHKFLVDIINELADALEEGRGEKVVGKIVNLMKYYAEWHFGREEKCMAEYECEVAGINQKAHRWFLDSVDEFQQRFRESGGSQEIAMEMYTTLTKWLVQHIQGVDGKLGGCILRHQQATG